jgi:hypothetical protein
MLTEFWSNNLGGIYDTEDLGEIRNNNKMETETELEGADWVHLAQGTDQWQAVMNTVMNLRVSQKVGVF